MQAIVTVLVAAAAIAGCVDSTSAVCGALVCSKASVCSPSGDRCVLPTQLDACQGKVDGDACDYPGVTTGVCSAEVCLPAGCGNGVIEPDFDEVCDDGNRVPLDGCSADCTSSERCGDGVVDSARGELCDCGDGTVAVDGCVRENSDEPGATCRADCSPARCGDAIRDPHEQCDDGNTAAGDGCRADCDGRWTRMQSGVFADLHAVWGTGPDNVFAVGDNTILHYDGTAWSSMPIPAPISYRGVWGSGNVVYAVGIDRFDGRVDRYDGTSWQVFHSYTEKRPLGIAGRSATDFWVVGETGGSPLLHHYSGTSWESESTYSCSLAALRTVWVAPTSNRVYVASPIGGGCEYTGQPMWRNMGLDAVQIWGAAGNDLYALMSSMSGSRLSRSSDGSSWTATDGANMHDSALALGGVPGDLVLVGGQGQVMTSTNGTEWSVSFTPVSYALENVWGYAPGRAFIVGDNGTILF